MRPREVAGVTAGCQSKHPALEIGTVTTEFHLLAGDRLTWHPDVSAGHGRSCRWGWLVLSPLRVGAASPSPSQCAGAHPCRRPACISGPVSASQPSRRPCGQAEGVSVAPSEPCPVSPSLGCCADKPSSGQATFQQGASGENENERRIVWHRTKRHEGFLLSKSSPPFSLS